MILTDVTWYLKNTHCLLIFSIYNGSRVEINLYIWIHADAENPGNLEENAEKTPTTAAETEVPGPIKEEKSTTAPNEEGVNFPLA